MRHGRRLEALWVVPISAALILIVSGPARVSAWSAQLRETRRVQAYLGENWDSVVAHGGRLDGGEKPPAVVIFSDYECVACRAAADSHKALGSAVGGSVVYRHFPLASHPMAEEAALVSICAQAQGRFREMHELLMADSSWMNGTRWHDEAQKAGVPDMEEFTGCLRAPSTRLRLEADMAQGRMLGLRGTPTIVGKGGVALGLTSSTEVGRLVR